LTDTGSYVRRPDQLLTGRIFAARGQGGAILIDWSGSMAWSYAALEGAIKTLPRLWCAAYSGTSDDGYMPAGEKYAGRLCVVARDGRIGDWQEDAERRKHHGANGCDWLALQYMVDHTNGPYVWVSDGAVCGDSHHAERCTAIMVKHRIARVEKLEYALDYLRGKSVRGAWDTPSRYGGYCIEMVRR
jgi:hypothetical protein